MNPLPRGIAEGSLAALVAYLGLGPQYGVIVAPLAFVAMVVSHVGVRPIWDAACDAAGAVFGGVRSVPSIRVGRPPWRVVVLLCVLSALGPGRASLPSLPAWEWPTITIHDFTPSPVVEKATAATYVYEKDQHAIPSHVLVALNRINRERGIVATLVEADLKDGSGDVPDQYKVPIAAAKQAGLPAVVVTAGDKVLSVLKDPKDEQAVLDAAK